MALIILFCWRSLSLFLSIGGLHGRSLGADNDNVLAGREQIFGVAAHTSGPHQLMGAI
jgi:hypothetical protein